MKPAQITKLGFYPVKGKKNRYAYCGNHYDMNHSLEITITPSTTIEYKESKLAK